MAGEQEENEALPPDLINGMHPAIGNGGRRNSGGGNVAPDVDCDGWCHTSVTDDKVVQ